MKKNILYFELSSGFGGSGNSLFMLLDNLDKQKYNPLVVVFNEGPQFDKIRKIGIKVIKLPFKRHEMEDGGNIFSFFKFLYDLIFTEAPLFIAMIWLLNKYRINLVHVNCEIIASIPVIISAYLTRIPVIVHLRATRRLVKREKLFSKLVTTFIVLTEKSKENYLKDITTTNLDSIYDGIDIARINWVNNGIDIQLLNARGEKEKSTSEIKDLYNLNGYSVIGLVGRIVEGKGHIDFVKAAKIVLQKRDQIKFMIVGAGELKIESELKDFIRINHLEENIIFTGWQTNILDYINTFDILVQASSTFPEGFGLTCIEAMALNKPVIATDIPGPSEIVVDGKTGFIVPPANPEKLAEAILKIIQDRDMARNMGIEGRRRVEEVFDIRKTAERIENLYSIILNE